MVAKVFGTRHQSHSQQYLSPLPCSTPRVPNGPAIWLFNTENEDRLGAKAFARDSNSLTGSNIWPSRSYCCTFCRREFRSAQALGGHMNIHRRDRARLRLSSPHSPPDSTVISTCNSPPDHMLSEVCFLYSVPTSFTSSDASAPDVSFHDQCGPMYNEDSGSKRLFGDVGLSSSYWESLKPQSENDILISELRTGKVMGDQMTTPTVSVVYGTECNVFQQPTRKEDSPEGLDLELRLGYKP